MTREEWARTFAGLDPEELGEAAIAMEEVARRASNALDNGYDQAMRDLVVRGGLHDEPPTQCRYERAGYQQFARRLKEWRSG